MSELLAKVSQERMLRNAHRLLKKTLHYRTGFVPLWSFVSEITGHGSTYSHQICSDLGWSPGANMRNDLPRKPAAPRAGGLDCGVDLETGKGVCVCGRCRDLPENIG